MRTATGLTLIALGAILAFAVQGHPSWLNIQVVGWVLILTGIVAMAIPRRGYGCWIGVSVAAVSDHRLFTCCQMETARTAPPPLI